MHEDLILRMAKDLKIVNYAKESKWHFIIRVLYSSLACWIKAAALDQPILMDNVNNSDGVSKKHVHDKCMKVLGEYLERFPFAKGWFLGEEHKLDPIVLIRERLYGSGDLFNAGFSTNVVLTHKYEKSIMPELNQIVGGIIDDQTFYSGVAQVIKKKAVVENMEWLEEDNSENWLKQFMEQAWWKLGDVNDENMEYFDASRKVANNLLWQAQKPKVAAGILLSRRPINKGSYEYILEKHVGNEVYHHRIDPFLQEIREYRRIMFALRALSNNRPPAIAKGDSNYVHLKLRVYLPRREQTLLETYAWPYNNIEDKLEWDMPYIVWQYLRQNLLNLGLDVKEEIHG